MGLLWLDYEEEFKTLVETAYKRERATHPDYYAALSPRVCQIIHRDTRYNVDYLYRPVCWTTTASWRTMPSGSTS